jgi:hypothetical protein
LIKSSFQIGYELGIIDHSKDLAPNYKQPSGIELHENVSAEWDSMSRCVWVSIALSEFELEIRRMKGKKTIIAEIEIQTQIK